MLDLPANPLLNWCCCSFLSTIRFVVRSDGAALAWRGPSGTNVRKLVMCPGKVVAAMVGDGQLGKIAMSPAGAGSW